MGPGRGATAIVSANLTLRLPNIPPAASDPHSLIDDLTVYIFHVVFYVILSGIFGILGTVSNTINIIVFMRQGLFSSNSNVNLFFLAVSDLGVAVTTWLYSIGFSLIVADTTALTTWSMPDIMVVVVGRPHAVFVLATRVITAYVTFERFVCVVLPFHVKTWLTPHRSLVFNVTVFAYFTAWMFPIYATSWLGFERQERTNASTLVTVSSPKFGVIMNTFYFVNFLVVDLTSVVISLVCTVVTSAHVKISKEWRRQTTSSSVADVSSCSSAAHQSIHNASSNSTSSPRKEELSSNNTSVTKSDRKMTRSTMDKETRLVKMITTIAILFLISYLPEVALSVLKMVDNRIQEYGQYHRLADVALSLIYVTSAINSTINILVYYSMSGKYRKEFKTLFGLPDTNKLC